MKELTGLKVVCWMLYSNASQPFWWRGPNPNLQLC